jgi:hypothetical protein
VRSSENEKLNACAEKGEKGNVSFPDPAYIRQLTDEYRWARTVRPAPHILVGSESKPTNISLYSSVLVGSESKPTNISLYSSVSKPMNII